jgi:hypothetical protein
MTIEELLALLTAKFQGARKDGLEQLAAALTLQCSSKEEAEAIIDKLTDEKVKGFIQDWRKKADAEISRAKTTYENGLKEKYDFVEKKKPGDPEPPKPQPEAITLEAIGKLIDQRLEGFTNTFTAKEAAEAYRKTFEGELDKAEIKGRQREMMLRSFDRANSFKTAADFNTYLEEAKGDIAAIKQEQADAGLGGPKPIFGAVNKEGVSDAVTSFLAAQGKENPLAGKTI